MLQRAVKLFKCINFLLLLLLFLLMRMCNPSFRNLLIENFIPPEEKNKILNRLHFDSEEDQWRLQPVLTEM